eukprot:Filipodium_phascolosomae@DN3822_c0_g1_i1.p2
MSPNVVCKGRVSARSGSSLFFCIVVVLVVVLLQNGTDRSGVWGVRVIANAKRNEEIERRREDIKSLPPKMLTEAELRAKAYRTMQVHPEVINSMFEELTSSKHFRNLSRLDRNQLKKIEKGSSSAATASLR